jgi:hypothetical protein
MWLTFQPDVMMVQEWMMDKCDSQVNLRDVVSGGNRHMHAVTQWVACPGLTIYTLDAPVVAFGEKSPIYFSKAFPDVSKGAHFSLYNNAWGTNYIQWFGEDLRFRFEVRT